MQPRKLTFAQEESMNVQISHWLSHFLGKGSEPVLGREDAPVTAPSWVGQREREIKGFLFRGLWVVGERGLRAGGREWDLEPARVCPAAYCLASFLAAGGGGGGLPWWLRW